MLAALAAGASHPAVAGLLGLGASGVAGGVVAMTWNVHARQIRLAEQLARRQIVVTAAGGPAAAGADEVPAQAAEINGHGRAAGPRVEAARAEAARVEAARAEGGRGESARGESARAERAQFAGARAGGAGANGKGATPPVIIEGPDTVLTGEQARFRVRPNGTQKVVSWAAGGGSVAQAPDPAHPDELLLIADQPGDLMVSARVRDGMTERRGTKSVTAVPDVSPAPPMPLRLFLHGWGLIVVAVLVVGFAGALVALGSLASADFIALVALLAALLGVIAVARGTADPPGQSGGRDTPRY
jgi:hypothetical protein